MKPLYLFVSFLVLITACSTPQMAFDDASGTPKEHYAVKGRQGLKIKQKLAFGNYHTTNIQRSWTRGSSSGVGVPGALWVEYEKRKQTFRFKLADEWDNNSEVFCITDVRTEELIFGRNPNSLYNIVSEIALGKTESVFVADIYPGNDGEMWQLVIDNDKAQRESRSYIGYLAKDADNYYKLVPARQMKIKNKTGSMPFGSYGFEIRNRAGQLVAAVSLMNNGEVYFGDVNKEEKFLLANACSALLLQDFID